MRFATMLMVLIISVFLVGCNEEPEESLWKLSTGYEVRENPVVAAIEPPGGAYAGIDEVSIIGQNFGESKEHVRVYFGNKAGEVVSVSDTEIRAIVPVIAGDSLLVKVQVDGAVLLGVFDSYKIEFAEGEYGGVTGQSDAYGIACDLNENLYISLGENKIIKIDQQENQTDYVTKDQGVDGFFKSMKMGPNGVLYAARTKYLYKVPAGGGNIYKFTVKKIPQAVNDFDFDPYGDIYVAAKKGIFFVQIADSSNTQAAVYSNITLNTIRVYDGYVYVAGSYTGFNDVDVERGVWRNKILGAGGQLGETELVLNWDNNFEGESTTQILAMTFSDDGFLYLGADSTANSEAITVIPPNADNTYSIENAEPLYSAVLMPPASVFCWGNDQYLYVNRKNASADLARMIKITMGKISAPYYGRM